MARRVSPDIEAVLAKADHRLARVMDAVIARKGPVRAAPSRTTPFEALVRAVVYQSISGNVAAAIFSRLRNALDDAVIPIKVLEIPSAMISAAGLSDGKTNTIRSLATWFITNRTTAAAIPEMADNDVARALMDVPGIGLWTVNVLLIFTLGRLDVLPAADIGIRRGVQLLYELPKPATPGVVREKAELWRPYRSIASMYLWNAMKLKLGPVDLRRERMG
jgi:DNA-3-methyladenine glycosylase II